MASKDKYLAYLRSNDWIQLSLAARLRGGNRCEFCGNSGDHVHHVKYPKCFTEDNLDNLVVVCQYHHSMLHGIRGEIMSGDCMLIEGIEVIKDENGVRWMDFDGLFSKVWSAQDGVVLYGDRARSESMNGAFAQIREKWKRIERFQLPGGTYRLRYLVTEQGASQFAASYRHHKMEPFQDWLFETVLPQIRNTGTYTHLQTTGNPVADLALHISKLGEATAQAVLDAEKASKIAIEAKLHADIANENADKANKIAIDAENDAKKANEKVDEVALRLDELTGGNFALTARQALLRMGVNPEEIYRGSQTNAMALGAYAAKWHRAHNVPMPPKIPEGTYMVGVYSRDALRDGVKALGISAQQAIH